MWLFYFLLVVCFAKINVPHGGDESEILLMSFIMSVVFCGDCQRSCALRSVWGRKYSCIAFIIKLKESTNVQPFNESHTDAKRMLAPRHFKRFGF